jgi:4-amino-4-deoxy-L-arabinose transferase-like glycosyltransferase
VHVRPFATIIPPMNREKPDSAGNTAQAASGPVLGRSYSRRDWQALLAVLLLALVLRGVLCSRLACISRDGVHFVTFARQLADDPIPAMKTTTKQPGFSWLLLGVHGVAGWFTEADSPIAWQRCGQALALLGGICACGLIFILTRRLFDAATASVAGVIAAVWPQGAHLSADVLSDMPHLALYLLAVFFAYRAMNFDRLGWLVPCGIVAGLAYMLRQEALGAVVGAALCWAWPDRRRSWPRQLAGAAVVVLCFSAVIAPHSIATGRLLPNKNPWEMLFSSPRQELTTKTQRGEAATKVAADLLVGRRPPQDLSGSRRNRALVVRGHGGQENEGGPLTSPGDVKGRRMKVVSSAQSAGLRMAAASFNPLSASLPARRDGNLLAEMIPWWKAPPKMIEAWAKSGRYIISTLFLLALILKTSPPAEPTGRRLVMAVVLLQLLAVQFRIKSYGEISSRYMIIPLVLSIPWAASGLLALLTIVSTRLRSVWNVQSIDVRTLGTVLAALPMLYYLARPVNYDKAQYRQAGEWLHQHARPDDLVLARDRLEQLMFYAGRTYPSRAWAQCAKGDSIEDIRSDVARYHPQWFVDAAGSRRAKIDEAQLFRALSSGAIPQLQSAWSGGTKEHNACVFRVAPPGAPRAGG